MLGLTQQGLGPASRSSDKFAISAAVGWDEERRMATVAAVSGYGSIVKGE